MASLFDEIRRGQEIAAMTHGPQRREGPRIPEILSLFGGWARENPMDAAAMATGPIPVLGDVAGLANDVRHYAQEPESITPGNLALSAAGLLPGVPAMAGISRRMTSATNKPMTYLEDPSLEEAIKFAEGTKYTSVRGITDPASKKVFVWDANDGTHHWMAQELGIDPRALVDGKDSWSSELENLSLFAPHVGIRVPGGK